MYAFGSKIAAETFGVSPEEQAALEREGLDAKDVALGGAATAGTIGAALLARRFHVPHYALKGIQGGVRGIGKGFKGTARMLTSPKKQFAEGIKYMEGVPKAERQIARAGRTEAEKLLKAELKAKDVKAVSLKKRKAFLEANPEFKKKYVQAMKDARTAERAQLLEKKPWLMDPSRRVNTLSEAVESPRGALGGLHDYGVQKGWTGTGKVTRWLPVGEKSIVGGFIAPSAVGAVKGPSQEKRELMLARGERIPGLAERIGRTGAESAAFVAVPQLIPGIVAAELAGQGGKYVGRAVDLMNAAP